MSFEPADVFWIEDAETFAILGDPKRLELLETFYKPRSVSEAAEILGVPRTRLYHHVKLLEESGMIKVADTRQAGAMTEKVYRVAAKSYRPSKSFLAGAAPKERAEALLATLLGATRADFVRSVHEGIAKLGNPDDEKQVTLSRGFLRLTPARLVEFIKELEALFERFHDESEDGEPESLRVAVLNVVYPSSRQI